jgi:carboxyl-terminal processing protease
MKILLRMKYIVVIMILLGLKACNTPSPSQSEDHQLSSETLIEVADSISQLMSAYHYNPAELDTEGYLELEKTVRQLAANPQSPEAFAGGFNEIWKEGPFSHVGLQVTDMTATDMAAYVDTLRVGEQSVSLEWMEQTAVLTVKTMMGMDTYERIFEMYKEIADKQAGSLIIDVRNNPGGAFAIIPLVGHVLKDTLDAGMFVSRRWWVNNTTVPDGNEVAQKKPWEGLSLRAFWQELQENPITRMQFKPLNPRFEGPVYVLTSSESASAAEFAVDALANIPSVTVIGEVTAGEMLSQKMYDLPYGFQLSVPIAEYYSTRMGKIEGKGVTPDIEIDQSVAVDVARMLINGETIDVATEKAEWVLNQNDGPPLKEEKIYLFGNMNDWGQQWNITPQFEYVGDGRYEAVTSWEPGDYEFKIAPMNWSFDYGAIANKEDVEIGEEVSLAREPGSPNLLLSIDSEMQFTFILDLSDVDHGKLLVSVE